MPSFISAFNSYLPSFGSSEPSWDKEEGWTLVHGREYKVKRELPDCKKACASGYLSLEQDRGPVAKVSVPAKEEPKCLQSRVSAPPKRSVGQGRAEPGAGGMGQGGCATICQFCPCTCSRDRMAQLRVSMPGKPKAVFRK